MTGPIDFSDITIGMQVTATTTRTIDGASSATSATVTAIEGNVLTLSNGDVVTAPAYADPGTTIGYTLDEDPPPPQPPVPALGTIFTDETGAAWQATGSPDALIMAGIDGTRLDWPTFLGAHPTHLAMEDEATTPLPDPVAPYPATIGPGDARLGMDIRVTVTYAGGDKRVTRGVCPWVQEDPPPDDDVPSFLCLPMLGGAQLVADQVFLDLVAATPALQDQITGRYVVQYDPVPAGVTLLVEQMEPWTADTTWDISGIPEPPDGSVVRSRTGIAWQRTGTATADGPVDSGGGGPYYFAGQGMWSSVVDSQPRNFFWLWGAAAPFTSQEPA